MILGPQKKYKTGDDLREWITSIQIAVQWLQLTEHEARMYIYSHIEDLAVKSSVKHVMREHQSAPLAELIVYLQIHLGAKSRAIILAEARNICRKNNEAVPPYSLRVRDIFEKKVLTDPNGPEVIKTEFYQVEMLQAFYRGLRSRFFMDECLKAGCKDLKEAVICISNVVACQIELDNVPNQEKDISLNNDKELHLHPEKGTFYVNNLFQVGELNFDGEVAVDSTSAMNFISNSSCTACGFDASHSVCPAKDKECYQCHRTGHYGRLCRSKNQGGQVQRAMPTTTPAQNRYRGRVNRRKVENKRINNLEVEEEDEQVGGIGSESE